LRIGKGCECCFGSSSQGPKKRRACPRSNSAVFDYAVWKLLYQVLELQIEVSSTGDAGDGSTPAVDRTNELIVSSTFFFLCTRTSRVLQRVVLGSNPRSILESLCHSLLLVLGNIVQCCVLVFIRKHTSTWSMSVVGRRWPMADGYYFLPPL
jgi:hypothetical protein